jgi:hypothetical protein
VPNRISSGELGDLKIEELNRALVFVHAGQIRPIAGGSACKGHLVEITPCVLYAEIVEGRVMKFGTTDSLVSRQLLNERTINNILAFQDGRSRSKNRKITDPTTYDKYKRQAPKVIREGKAIEIWATSLSVPALCQDAAKRFNAKCAACESVEYYLNIRYKTIEHGSASRPN